LLVREAIRKEDLPLDLHIAHDGLEAIQFLETAEHDPNAACPHIVLLDINLPKVDGFAVLKRLRQSEKCKGIPVIVISSSDAPGDRDAAARFGARYFRKPPSYEQYMKLGNVLRQALHELGFE